MSRLSRHGRLGVIYELGRAFHSGSGVFAPEHRQKRQTSRQFQRTPWSRLQKFCPMTENALFSSRAIIEKNYFLTEWNNTTSIQQSQSVNTIWNCFLPLKTRQRWEPCFYSCVSTESKKLFGFLNFLYFRWWVGNIVFPFSPFSGDTVSFIGPLFCVPPERLCKSAKTNWKWIFPFVS